MTWTQPSCESCYAARHLGREPIRLTDPDRERCAFCGEQTTAGIYVRANPAEVPFPREDMDDG